MQFMKKLKSHIFASLLITYPCPLFYHIFKNSHLTGLGHRHITLHHNIFPMCSIPYSFCKHTRTHAHKRLNWLFFVVLLPIILLIYVSLFTHICTKPLKSLSKEDIRNTSYTMNGECKSHHNTIISYHTRSLRLPSI